MNSDKSHYHFAVGEFNCIAIRDGSHMGSADFLFDNAPAEQLNAALQKANLESDQLPSSWTCLLVDTGREKLLVDTGIGGLAPEGGKLPSLLEELDYQPSDIDIVFLTHGHPDHVGGCTDQDEKPLFANAQFVTGKQEFEFWTDGPEQPNPENWMAQFSRQKLLAIQDQVELVGNDSELLPGIRTVEAFGHTPGHLALEIHSQGETLLNLADTVLHPLHLQHPEWVSQVDIIPDRMISTRLRLLERAAREEALVLFFHFDFPSLGHVEQDGQSWTWRSLLSF
jgi:glyoxylase-like metal-dependent hydrolase (beta-lactamase superfamily II)